MTARIYRPARAATQSGRGRTAQWVLEHEPAAPSLPGPLMGWSGGRGTRRQVRLTFPSLEAAVAYAKRSGLACAVEKNPHTRRVRPKAYADNFAHGRAAPWTH